MMLWCELHNTSGIKGGGITNFDPTEYEKDLAWLQTVTQACSSSHCAFIVMHLHTKTEDSWHPARCDA